MKENDGQRGQGDEGGRTANDTRQAVQLIARTVYPPCMHTAYAHEYEPRPV